MINRSIKNNRIITENIEIELDAIERRQIKKKSAFKKVLSKNDDFDAFEKEIDVFAS